MDLRGKDVEKWKLTDEQKSFQKQVKSYEKIREILNTRSLMISYEAKKVTDMMLELNKRFKMLQPPSQQVRELDGMNFGKPGPEPTKQQLMINY